MTLQRANWLAQLMRKWGYRTEVLYSAVKDSYVVFAHDSGKAAYVYEYKDAVRLWD